MKYYNSLVAKKLACICEIQRTFQLIDTAKKDNQDPSEHLEMLEKLKATLESLNVRILSHQVNVLASGSPPDWPEPGPAAPSPPSESDFQDEAADEGR